VTQYVSIEMKLTVLFIRTGITYVFSVLMMEIAYLVHVRFLVFDIFITHFWNPLITSLHKM